MQQVQGSADEGSDVKAKTAGIGLFAAWIFLMVGSVVMPYVTPPTGSGFTAGMNRITLFFQFQIAGAVLAAALLFCVKRVRKSKLRWLFRVPMIWFGLLVLGIVGLILWANFARPAPGEYVPPGPVAAPALETS